MQCSAEREREKKKMRAPAPRLKSCWRPTTLRFAAKWPRRSKKLTTVTRRLKLQIMWRRLDQATILLCGVTGSNDEKCWREARAENVTKFVFQTVFTDLYNTPEGVRKVRHDALPSLSVRARRTYLRTRPQVCAPQAHSHTSCLSRHVQKSTPGTTMKCGRSNSATIANVRPHSSLL